MKRKLIFALLCSSAICHASVLRVNNVDTSAPYSTIAKAVEAAAEGDTILVEGSTVDYDATTIDKRLVIMGHGYWLRENGIATEAAESANIQSLTTTAEGSAFMGLHVWKAFRVEGAKTVVTRCRLDEGVSIAKGANNCVIHQCFLTGDVGSGYDHSYYHQITNNIFGSIGCKGIGYSYIAYNTSYTKWGESFWNTDNCKIEKNVFYTSEIDTGDGNTIQDNYVAGDVYENIQTDMDVRDTEMPDAAKGYGAFAGEDPYVISGILAGPMIEELTIPASVEEGGTFEATVKIGHVK